MATTFPDDCIQTLVDPWWVKNNGSKLCRGALIWAFLPHVDQAPYAFTPIGRKDPLLHSQAQVQVTALSVNAPLKQTALPVAAMPQYRNEVWAAYRAKSRPCLVLSEECPHIDKGLTQGMAKHASAPTMLVAPYYGTEKVGNRVGFNPAFIDRIRHCEYPQYFWDKLPIDDSAGSVLRLDHVQPLGCHHQSYRLTAFKLSDCALEIVDTMLDWVLTGNLPAGHELLDFRSIMMGTSEEGA